MRLEPALFWKFLHACKMPNVQVFEVIELKRAESFCSGKDRYGSVAAVSIRVDVYLIGRG